MIDIVDHYWNAMRSWNVNKWSLRFLCTVYLLSSYMYYHLDTHLLSDTEYDQLCRTILDRWQEVLDDDYIWHHRLMDRELLEAGSGFSIREDCYPDTIRSVAKQLAIRLGNEQRLEAIDDFIKREEQCLR